jgi:TolA-binding protein
MIALFYRETAYRKYAYYWLALYLEQDDAERSLVAFERVLNEHPDFPLADEVRYRMLKLRERLGRQRDYLAALQKLLSRTTDVSVRDQIRKAIRKAQGDGDGR